MKRWSLIFLLLSVGGFLQAGDNSATMGSWAEDFPSLRMWRAGNAYDGDLSDASGFWGRNIARMTGGSGNYGDGQSRYMFDLIKDTASAHGRTVILEVYTDYHFYVECGDASTEDTMGSNAITYNYQKVVDSLGLTFEDYFFHLADDSDSIVYVLRSTTCAEAADADRKWGNASLSNGQKRQSQFGVYSGTDDENYPGTDAYFMDYTDTAVYSRWKALAYLRLKNQTTKFFSLDSTVDGFTFDNSTYGSQRSVTYVDDNSSLNWWSFGGNTGGATWQEGTASIDWVGWDAPFVNGGASSETLWNRWCAGAHIMFDSMKHWGITRSANFVNAAASRVDEYANRRGSEPVVTLFCELQMNDVPYEPYSILTSHSSSKGIIARFDSLIYWGIPHAQELRSFGANQTTWPCDTGRAVWIHDLTCLHWAIMDTALTYYCLQNKHNSGVCTDGVDSLGDTLIYTHYELLTYDLGDQISRRNYVDTGTTQDADNVHLFWAEYDNGFAFWFAPDAMADTVNARSTNYYEWDCGEAVYEIGRTSPGHADSTYRSDGVIRIGPGTGVLAMKASGGAPGGSGNKALGGRVRK